MSLTLTAALMTIATPDCDRLATFYQQLLDQPPVKHIPTVYAEFQLAGVILGLFQPKTAATADWTPRPQPDRGLSLCLEVADLEQAIAHLTHLGYPPPGPIMTASHGREIYAYDPDGNGLILHQSHSKP